MHYTVVDARYVRDYVIWLKFQDGSEGEVDLSSEFESGGGSADVLTRLGQMVYTLTQFPTVKSVVIQIEGETYYNIKIFRFYIRCPRCSAEITFKTDQVKNFRTIKIQSLRAYAFFELAGQHAHADEITSVDTFETLRDDRLNAEQSCSLCCPIA